MKGKETFIKVIEDPVLYAEDHNLIIVLFDLKKLFVEYDFRSNYLSTLKEIIELKRESNIFNLTVIKRKFHDRRHQQNSAVDRFFSGF